MSGKKASSPLGGGEITGLGSVDDAQLARLIGSYRRTVAGRYRGLRSEEITAEIPQANLHVSPKIDGQLWYLICEESDLWLASPTGRTIRGGLPLLKEAKKTLPSRCKGRVIIAGELFAVADEGRPRCGHLAMVLGAGAKAETKRLGFVAFDLVEGGDEQCPLPSEAYEERYATLSRLLDGGKRARVTQSATCSGPAEVADKFAEWVEGGKAEGLVVRDSGRRIYKVKPAFKLQLAVIGYTERSEDPQQVGSLLYALIRSDGSFQLAGATGNVGNDEQRTSLQAELSTALVPSSFKYASSSGAMYRFVEPKVVVEVTATDVQAEDGSGAPIRRPILVYDSETGWTPRRPLPGVSLLHSKLSRICDDKTVSEADVGTAQLTERCYVQALDEASTEADLPTSELVRREAYAKTTKGKDAVRKLVVWKTNKEALDPRFPAYVVHFTDFSPSRKAPLKREVRLAPDETAALAIADALIADNIKKGWARIDSSG